MLEVASAFSSAVHSSGAGEGEKHALGPWDPRNSLKHGLLQPKIRG